MDIRTQLQKVNLQEISQEITVQRENFIVNPVNASCLRLAVSTGEYPWHFHANSDELFMVVEGELYIDLRDRETIVLKPNEIFTIPKGVIHRTRSNVRTVNLCFEDCAATTEFVEEQ